VSWAVFRGATSLRPATCRAVSAFACGYRAVGTLHLDLLGLRLHRPWAPLWAERPVL